MASPCSLDMGAPCTQYPAVDQAFPSPSLSAVPALPKTAPADPLALAQVASRRLPSSHPAEPRALPGPILHDSSCPAELPTAPCRVNRLVTQRTALHPSSASPEHFSCLKLSAVTFRCYHQFKPPLKLSFLTKRLEDAPLI